MQAAVRRTEQEAKAHQTVKPQPSMPRAALVGHFDSVFPHSAPVRGSQSDHISPTNHADVPRMGAHTFQRRLHTWRPSRAPNHHVPRPYAIFHRPATILRRQAPSVCIESQIGCCAYLSGCAVGIPAGTSRTQTGAAWAREWMSRPPLPPTCSPFCLSIGRGVEPPFERGSDGGPETAGHGGQSPAERILRFLLDPA